MTVKEIFELRKQGCIEEAYEAIRPMYAAHKGRYTTLCMFWTAADVFKLRVEQNCIEEAEKILEALKRLLPRVEEINKQLDREAAAKPPVTPKEKLPWEHNDKKQPSNSAAFITSATRRLAKVQKEKDSKKAPSGVIAISRGGKPTVPETDTHSEPHRGDTTPVNPSHPCSTTKTVPSGLPADTVLTGSSKEKKDSVLIDSVDEKKDSALTGLLGEEASKAPSNTQLLNDYPGHMIVSLEDGIIRPIAGINAPQRIVLACLVAHPGYSVPQISESTGIPAKSVERHVAALIDRGLIEHRGSKKTGGYHAL